MVIILPSSSMAMTPSCILEWTASSSMLRFLKSLIFLSRFSAIRFMVTASSDNSSASGTISLSLKFPLANFAAPVFISSTGCVIFLATTKLTMAAARIVNARAIRILFLTDFILLSKAETETAVRTTAITLPFCIIGSAIYIILLSSVELYRMDTPFFPFRASIISGRFMWFSITSISPKESPTTTPEGKMMVTRVPVFAPISLQRSSIRRI